ncbi:MAG: DUF2304 domain-containing protein [Erysipelotrichaceae bacterium]|nr:DUF2304 domain-containing protein [Erysipelotrichaceae bacterium]
MTNGLRLGLLLASLGVFIVIILAVVKKRLNIRYSIVWILWALLSLFLAVFPETFYSLSHLLGIQVPVNTVFLIMTALLYALTLYVYIMISKHNEEIIKLTYQISLLKKELDELKGKDER